MPIVYIPPLLRDLTRGRDTISVQAADVRQVIAALEESFPGIAARLCEGESLRPGLALIVDTEVSRQGLQQRLRDHSEVHFLPQVSGG
jgi:molybdopterin synthase sulfur carrier subunit